MGFVELPKAKGQKPEANLILSNGLARTAVVAGTAFVLVFLFLGVVFHFVNFFLFLFLDEVLVVLALGDAFLDGVDHLADDEGDALRGVVVGGDGEVDEVGVGVGVDDGEGRDVELAGFSNGDVFLHDVDHEQG